MVDFKRLKLALYTLRMSNKSSKCVQDIDNSTTIIINYMLCRFIYPVEEVLDLEDLKQI